MPVETPSVRSKQELSDIEWDVLLMRIQRREVVPLLGPKLISVQTGAEDAARWKRPPGWMLLETYLTLRLAEEWCVMTREPRISPEMLPDEARFHHFVGHYLDGRGDREGLDMLYGYVASIAAKTTFTDEADAPLPARTVRVCPAVRQLAEISDFDLYLTTTGDSLLEEALARCRPGGVLRPSPAFNKERPTDLPATTTAGQAVVYHLFGQYEAGARRFVLTEDDLLDYVVSLQARDTSLGRLNDILRSYRLLLLGGGYHDWLARFILRTAKPRLAAAEEVLADTVTAEDDDLRLFLKRFSPKTTILTGESAGFVQELHRRWSDSRSSPSGSKPSISLPAPVMPGKCAFISYASGNREHALRLRDSLEAAGVQAWFDVEQLEAGDNWDQKIRLNIQRCTVFLPLVSLETERRLAGYFRREWNDAVRRSEEVADGVPFIMPFVVDPELSSSAVKFAPSAFRKVQWAKAESATVVPTDYIKRVAAAHEVWLQQ